jgi:hypothetical protein
MRSKSPPLLFDGVEGGDHSLALVAREDFGAFERLRPGDGALDVLLEEAVVEAQGVIEPPEKRVGGFRESAGPEGMWR